MPIKRNTSNNLKTIYELKEEYYDHYNPYFYHYTNSERAKV
jgi:E3 ubiquitin-protein ligase UBR2